MLWSQWPSSIPNCLLPTATIIKSYRIASKIYIFLTLIVYSDPNLPDLDLQTSDFGSQDPDLVSWTPDFMILDLQSTANCIFWHWFVDSSPWFDAFLTLIWMILPLQKGFLTHFSKELSHIMVACPWIKSGLTRFWPIWSLSWTNPRPEITRNR